MQEFWYSGRVTDSRSQIKLVLTCKLIHDILDGNGNDEDGDDGDDDYDDECVGMRWTYENHNIHRRIQISL